MRNIKNIIFDLGGVLLNIDFNKTINAFTELGYTHFEKQFSQFTITPFFEKLETGKINENVFLKQMKAMISHSVSDNQIITAWNALIVNFRITSLQFLSSIADKYNLYLLSNTNIIHFNHFQQLYTTETGKTSLDNLFNKAWYSHKVGLRKPYKPIYEYILHDENLIPAETLFIDDIIDNIKIARQLGIQTHHLSVNERIENLNL